MTNDCGLYLYGAGYGGRRHATAHISTTFGVPSPPQWSSTHPSVAPTPLGAAPIPVVVWLLPPVAGHCKVR